MPVIGLLRLQLVAALALLVAFAQPLRAADVQPAGEVVFTSGIATAQRPGESARVLGRGDVLHEGDVVSTGSRAFAVLHLRDGSRMTLRPNTVFGLDRYAHGGEEENVLLRLFKGGLRAVTGLVAKRNPDGYRIATSTVTIGIRGTDFDARLCEADCGIELKGLAGSALPQVQEPVIARVARLNGSAVATSPQGATRALVNGAPLFAGDAVQTERGAMAVLAFRDQSRVTLQSGTRFVIEEFSHGLGARTASMALRLIRGGLRAVTGLVAKENPQAFRVATSVATIGIRGSGFDLLCEGLCADGNEAPAPQRAAPQSGDGLFLHTWQGVAEVRFDTRTLVVEEGRAALFASGAREPTLLPVLPAFMRDNPAPRPDTLEIDHAGLFQAQTRDEAAPGLYVLVRDGHVTLSRDGEELHIGNGESAYTDPAAREMVRLVAPARVLELDAYPRPDRFDPAASAVEPRAIGAPAGTGGRGVVQECEVR
jgi:hypothetical protein